MMKLLQVFAIFLVAIISFASTGTYGSGLVVILLWLAVWFGDRRIALGYAVALGLIFDITGFIIFGYWTVVFSSTVLLVSYLKEGFLTVSSFWQSILMLVVMTILIYLIQAVTLSGFDFIDLSSRIIANVIIGSTLYYLLAIKMNLFQRWIGTRL